MWDAIPVIVVSKKTIDGLCVYGGVSAGNVDCHDELVGEDGRIGYSGDTELVDVLHGADTPYVVCDSVLHG